MPARAILYADGIDDHRVLRVWSESDPRGEGRELTFGVRNGLWWPTLDRSGSRLMLVSPRSLGADGTPAGGWTVLSVNLDKPHLSPARLLQLEPGQRPAWPRLAPGERLLSLLEQEATLPVRPNVPARLVLYGRSGHDWAPTGTVLPALFADYDWGPEDNEVLYRDPERGLVLAALEPGAGATAIDGHARFPVTSPSGQTGAFYARREVTMVSAGGRRSHRLPHAVSAMTWDLGDEALLLALAPSFHRTVIARMDAATGELTPLFEAHSVTFLGATLHGL